MSLSPYDSYSLWCAARGGYQQPGWQRGEAEAAEQAVPTAADVFVATISTMNVDDALGMLHGGTRRSKWVYR